MKRLLISVSGGRTSALMAKLLWDRYQKEYEMLFVFANTSREREETLEFVRDIEINFGIPIVWVEAVVNPEKGEGTTHKIVDFDTAKRDGSVFESVIAKYGIPGIEAPHCTRELKAKTIRSLAKKIGWGNYKKYITAIGYRSDEHKRVNLIKAKQECQWYPLWDWRINKQDVLKFWRNQSFDLTLKHEYEGNCKLCYKKSRRKLIQQIQTDPSATEWVLKMENRYDTVTPEGYTGPLPIRFFRDSESIIELIQLSELGVQTSLFDEYYDEQESCAESCEPF